MTRIIWKDIKDKVSRPSHGNQPEADKNSSSSFTRASRISYARFLAEITRYLDIDLKYYDLVRSLIPANMG